MRMNYAINTDDIHLNLTISPDEWSAGGEVALGIGTMQVRVEDA